MSNILINTFNRLNTYRDGLSVERLHTHYHNLPYNNGFHSANAALIADEIARFANFDQTEQLSIVRYMLLHDVAERFVGDIPSPFKRVLGEKVKGLMDEAEGNWLNSKGIQLPDLSEAQKEVCKVADIIELMEYSKREMATGNTSIEIVITNCKTYLGDMLILNSKVRCFVSYYLRNNNGN